MINLAPTAANSVAIENYDRTVLVVMRVQDYNKYYPKTSRSTGALRRDRRGHEPTQEIAIVGHATYFAYHLIPRTATGIHLPCMSSFDSIDILQGRNDGGQRKS